MTEQYPFFRDEDERTQAVIGEDAAASDLDGTYQKPYAIMTQKRLYCKNEAGNFITEAKALRSAQKAHLPGQNWFLWGAAACVLVAAVCAILVSWEWNYSEYRSYEARDVVEIYRGEKVEEMKDGYRSAQGFLRKVGLMKPCSIALAVAFLLLTILTAIQHTKQAVTVAWVSAGLSLAFLWCSDVFGKAYDWNNEVVSVWERYLYGSDKMVILAILVCAFLCAVLSLLALVLYRRRTVYQITHATGAFHFTPSLYPEEEFENFTARVENLNPEEEAHV